MAAIESLALALGKAVTGEIGKEAGRPIIERGKTALGLDPTRRALRCGLQRALERFDAEHRSWISSFFDEHFLKSRVAPLLARMIASGDAPTPRELAVAWRAQFGAGQAGIDDVEPAAAAFLRIVRKELRAEEQLRKMLDSHGIDTISEAVVTIAERQPGSLPTRLARLPAAREERRVWRVKAASPRFTDRDAEMQRIHADLADDPIVAIHGLGGVGKSQLAAEYARRHPDEYDVAWWVRADNEKTLMEDLAELAYTLGVAAASDSNQRAAAAAREWLERNDRWLLLLDDAANPEDLLELIPQAPVGHVVVTSRRHADWLAIGARAIELGVWERADSVRFLAERTGDDDDAAAAAVAQALGDLPLALEQAAAYANKQRISLATYLDRLGDRDRDLLSVGAPRDYGRSVATTWSLALDEVGADPVARFVLAVCAFLTPEQIPRALFYAHVKDASAGGSAVEKLDQAIERLLGYSLVSADDESLSIHRALGPDGMDRPKSRHGVRDVPLPQPVVHELREHLARLADHGPAVEAKHGRLAFPSTVGTPMDANNLRREVLKPAAEEADVAWAGFHAFRHAFASLHIERGTNIVRLARLLGHHKASFTLDVYAHLLDDGLGDPLDLDAELTAGNTGGNTSNGNEAADTPHGAVDRLPDLAR